MKKTALAMILVAACLASGYVFYRMNPHDIINSVCFTIGILGIMLSVLRKKPNPESKELDEGI
jgi:hypothetical protein